MERFTKGYLYFEDDKNIIRTCEILNFVESGGLIELIVLSLEMEPMYVYIPMVIRSDGEVYWSMRKDESGNNLYDKFPYKVVKLNWEIKYMSVDERIDEMERGIL